MLLPMIIQATNPGASPPKQRITTRIFICGMGDRYISFELLDLEHANDFLELPRLALKTQKFAVDEHLFRRKPSIYSASELATKLPSTPSASSLRGRRVPQGSEAWRKKVPAAALEVPLPRLRPICAC